MDQEIQETTDRARAGETPHITRYILAISLFLAAAILTIVWVTGALTSDGDSAGQVETAPPVVQPSTIPHSPDQVTAGAEVAPLDERNQRSSATVD